MLLSEILPEDKRRLNELEIKLLELEKGNASVKISDVRIGIEDMANRLEELEKLVQRESKSRRNDMKRRVQHLKMSLAHVKESFDAISMRRSCQDLESQRKELLGESSTDPVIFDLEAAESSSLSRSNRMVYDYLESGRETLSELLAQKDRLKSIQRKVFDIMNLLGISNSIMRLVEKRDFVDKWIVFGGMILVTFLLFIVYWYWRQ